MHGRLLECVVQKSQTGKTAAPKRSTTYEPPQIFRTDEYFLQHPVAVAMNECNTAVSNGTVVSSCSTDSLSNVPSGACFENNSLEPTVKTDSPEWTYNSCSESAEVDEMSSKDGTHNEYAVISDSLLLNDASQ